MAQRTIGHAFLALLGLGLAGCASQPRTDLAHLPGKDACFWTRTIFDWTVIDDSTVLVRAPSANDTYLLKLFAPIPGLKFHQVLGFQGGDGMPGQFCRQNGYVIARGPPGPDRLPVVAVRSITAAQAKQILANAPGAVRHPAGAKPPAQSN